MSIEYNPKYLKHFYDPVWENFENGFWQGIKQRKLKAQATAEVPAVKA